ncbi:MAG: 23S rRNA (adenine(2503)-C(2))-methyltransferase RlmN [bacterium]
MDYNCITNAIRGGGISAYRLKQVKKAVFVALVSEWREVLVLPASLRESLNSNCPLSVAGKIRASKETASVKAIIELGDGLEIESVLMRHNNNRNTVCVSSQVGCPLGCLFCATGKMGFKRNLTSSEIIEQVIFFARLLKEEQVKVTNIVFMGMGEPFLNYQEVITAIDVLNDKDGFNLGIRHFSISTAGIIEGINKLKEEGRSINLAISLHNADDKLRQKMMPVAVRYPLNELLKSIDEYIKHTGRKVMFEYLMIKGVNDSLQDADKLASIMKKPLYMVNLIRYNPTGDFEPSKPEVITAFRQRLIDKGISVTQRYHFGGDINAACGQLII